MKPIRDVERICRHLLCLLVMHIVGGARFGVRHLESILTLDIDSTLDIEHRY